VDIARLAATDFLERPVSIRQLRTAVRKALAPT
jgi:FixJ family two-component response regulator